MKFQHFHILFIILQWLACSCSGDGFGVDANGHPDGWQYPQASFDTSQSDCSKVYFQQIQQRIFSAICTDCHKGSTAPKGLEFTPKEAPAIVGRASSEKPDLFIVNPGDPESSYIIWKVEGRKGILGRRMPRNRNPLSAEDIALIRQWISSLDNE